MGSMYEGTHAQAKLDYLRRERRIVEQEIAKLEQKIEQLDAQIEAELPLTIDFLPLPESDRLRIHRALNKARKAGLKPSMRRMTSYNPNDFLDHDAYIDFDFDSEGAGWEARGAEARAKIVAALRAEGLSVDDGDAWSSITVEPSVVFFSVRDRHVGWDDVKHESITKLVVEPHIERRKW